MKILWHSNAPWAPSGYGNQTKTFVPRIAADHDIAISAFFGLYGASQEWEGIRIFPGGYEGYGNDMIVGHAGSFFGGNPRDGLVVTLVDAYVLQPDIIRQVNALCWAPVDHTPAPSHVIDFFKATDAIPLAMSKHGEEMFTNAGLEPLYVPHGYEPADFYPDPDNRYEFRKKLQWPESAFVVSMVAANKGNPSRKGFPEALMAFAEFSKKRTDSMLYLHTEPHGIVDGVDLPVLLRTLGIPPNNIRFIKPYDYAAGIPPKHLNMVYNASDVLLNPSYGEGFGIPIIEAQACGCPVIVTNHTSMPELAGVGWLANGQPYYTNQRSFQMIPDVDELVWALEDAYTRASRLRDRCVESVAPYSADRVYLEHWVPVLEAAWERVTAPKELEFDLVGAEE